MDLSKRNFLLGLGIGILSSSFIFYVTYAYVYMRNDIKLSSYIDEYSIINVIKETGMLLYLKVDITDESNTLEIAEILYDKNLIDDVVDFENYLNEIGINKINRGVFYIPLNADYAAIAKIFTGE